MSTSTTTLSTKIKKIQPRSEKNRKTHPPSLVFASAIAKNRIFSVHAIFNLINAKTHLELNWSVELKLEEAYTIPTTQPGPGYL